MVISLATEDGADAVSFLEVSGIEIRLHDVASHFRCLVDALCGEHLPFIRGFERPSAAVIVLIDEHDGIVPRGLHDILRIADEDRALEDGIADDAGLRTQFESIAVITRVDIVALSVHDDGQGGLAVHFPFLMDRMCLKVTDIEIDVVVIGQDGLVGGGIIDVEHDLMVGANDLVGIRIESGYDERMLHDDVGGTDDGFAGYPGGIDDIGIFIGRIDAFAEHFDATRVTLAYEIMDHVGVLGLEDGEVEYLGTVTTLGVGVMQGV